MPAYFNDKDGYDTQDDDFPPLDKSIKAKLEIDYYCYSSCNIACCFGNFYTIARVDIVW